jgi:hypothetical protein
LFQKSSNTVDGGLRDQIKEQIKSKKNLWSETISGDDEKLLEDVILQDIIDANEKISQSYSIAAYAYEPIQNVVNKLFDQIIDLMEYLDQKDGKQPDTTAKTLFYPFLKKGAQVIADSNIKKHYG